MANCELQSPPSSVGIDVTQVDEFTELQVAFLQRANLSDVAPVEAWTVRGSNRRMGYSTHGIFRYFGKFPPPIATSLIDQYSSPGELVVDPMCGSGTTGVEAILANRRCELADVNPLSVLLSQVKTTNIPLQDSREAIERVVSRVESKPKADYRPTGLRNLDHWFLPETISSLSAIRSAIDRESEGSTKRLLLVAFASIVRRASKATTQQGRLFLDPNTALADALPLFERTALTSASAVAELEVNSPVRVTQDNLMSPSINSIEKAKLSIIHPPYFNMYKYSSINSLEMAWLDMDAKVTRKQEVREYFKIGKPENVERYLIDMESALANACEQVASDGVAALMIGDTTIRGEHIRATRPLLDTLPSRVRVEKIALRVPKFTEATWAASQRRKGGDLGVRLYDLIVILRKGA